MASVALRGRGLLLRSWTAGTGRGPWQTGYSKPMQPAHPGRGIAVAEDDWGHPIGRGPWLSGWAAYRVEDHGKEIGQYT